MVDVYCTVVNELTSVIMAGKGDNSGLRNKLVNLCRAKRTSPFKGN